MMDKSKKAVIIISVFLLLSVSAVINIYAESIWEGSAAMGRYGEFPMSGYYGASNSFPKNAYVEVENLESGKKTRLIVVDRLSNSGLLMLVSNEAAQELGIYQNNIARIKVRLLSSARTEPSVEFDDLAYNPDPDINPAASMTSPEELAYLEIEAARNTAETAADEIAESAEDEPVIEEVIETVENEPVIEEPVEPVEPVDVVEEVETVEAETTAVVPLPIDADELAEAEARITEGEAPDTVSDIPEKPFDWPDTIIAETKAEPEPLYLTMDNLDESQPAPEEAEADGSMAAPEALSLWPDDSLPSTITDEADEMEAPALEQAELSDASPEDSADSVSDDYNDIPESELQLLFSGLAETEPEDRQDSNFKTELLPEIVQKEEEEGEYVKNTTDYHSPAASEQKIAENNLPSPEPYIPEEVLAALVGDSTLISDAFPDEEGLESSYLEVPEIEDSEDTPENRLQPELAEAEPLSADAENLVSADLPALPGSEDKFPINVAAGYAEPDVEDFKADITDFPDYMGATEPVEIPETGDELAFNEAPASDDDIIEMPEALEVPEVADSAMESASSGEPVTDDTEPAVPVYDENLEISLQPAEERPPELLTEDPELAEAEPEAAEIDSYAGHEPDVEAAEVVETVETVETVEVEDAGSVDSEIVKEAEAEDEPVPVLTVSVPDRVVMADKLEQKRHYLQLGAFREKNSALTAAGRLEQGYPVMILTDGGGENVSYKLLLGPLSADESGVLLYNFRAGGYSDAFIRRNE